MRTRWIFSNFVPADVRFVFHSAYLRCKREPEPNRVLLVNFFIIIIITIILGREYAFIINTSYTNILLFIRGTRARLIDTSVWRAKAWRMDGVVLTRFAHTSHNTRHLPTYLESGPLAVELRWWMTLFLNRSPQSPPRVTSAVQKTKKKTKNIHHPYYVNNNNSD